MQQKKAIRAISLAKYNSHTEKACKDLKILRIEEMFELRCLKFLYNIQNNTVPVYFSNDFLDGANSTTRTLGASQCLRFHLRNVIIPRTPQNILEKIHTHSFDGFSLYAKNSLLNRYVPCRRGPETCFPCRFTR